MTTKRTSFSRIFSSMPVTSILLSLAVSITSAQAQPAASLFQEVNTGEVPAHVSLPATAKADQTLFVRVNTGLLKSGHFELDLPDGQNLGASRTLIQSFPEGSEVWQGNPQGDSDGLVLFSRHGSAVSGMIQTGGKLYGLKPVGQGIHALSELDPNDPSQPDTPVMPDTAHEHVGESASPAAGMEQSAASGTVIDVMVVYTPAMLNAYQTHDGVKAHVAQAVAAANAAYSASGVDLQLRLVHSTLVNYTQTSDMGTDLERLRLTNDGYMDEVHGLRDQYGADLVSMMGNAAGGAAGIAYLAMHAGSNGSLYAFSVVAHDYAVWYYTFAHELGHNFGSAHDHQNSTNGLSPYSYGHWIENGSSAYIARTIMAYNCSGGCSRVGHFSNPGVAYSGYPTGVADYADNARSINDVKNTAAAWRSAATATPPSAPDNLLATALAEDSIDLNWSDTSSDETGFRLLRSTDGVNYQTIASPGANVSQYQDTGLSAATTYYYQAQAYNGAGTSSSSNTASATTYAAAAAPPAAPDSLVLAGSGVDHIGLSWFDNAIDETGFSVERSPDGSSWVQVAGLPADTQSFTDLGLAAGSDYFYRVSAFNDGGASDYSNILQASTDAAPVLALPSAPNGLVVTDGADGTALLNWLDNSDNESAFEIQRENQHKKKGTWMNTTIIGSVSQDVTQYTDSSGSGTYRYQVRAVNSAGASAWSNWVEVSVTEPSGGGSNGKPSGGGNTCKGKKC